MKKISISALMILMAICSFGQNWGEIKSNKDQYFCAESSAATKVQAVKKADTEIEEQIKNAYSGTFQLTKGEQQTFATMAKDEQAEYLNRKIKSYKIADNYHTLEIQEESPVIVGRYISRQEIDDIMAKRKVTINRYISEALTAEKERNLSVALRYYYWSYMLTATLQNPDAEKYDDRKSGNTYNLTEWLPEKINSICEGIDIQVTERNENNITLRFTYKGQDVSTLDFRCKTKSTWSALYSAKDGQGEIELPDGYTEDNLNIKYEYRYEEESEHLDEAVYDAFSFIASSITAKKGTSTIGLEISQDAATAMSQQKTSRDISHLEELTDADKQKYKKTIDAVVAAIRSKNNTNIQQYFTSEGYDIYEKLIKYGSARVKEYSDLSYTRMGNDVIVRSIPMSFTFKNGSVRSFIEDVVFTIDDHGKINNISFGLGKEATAAIMARDKWGDTIQQQVINFLEVYKTAYALKRYEYLETLFADNAVIIVGKVVMQASKYPDADRYGAHKIVLKTRFTKEKYMEHLKKCFNSNEFINIRFAKTSVTKKNKEQIFGIQLKQFYNSSTYGDEGYLFLQVDMRNPSEPVIMVRTWQEEYDPEVGRPYGMQDF